MLCSNLKYLRTYSKLTQSEFADLFELSRSNVDSYERGNAKPKPESLKAIAEHFKLSIDILYNVDLNLNPGLIYEGAPTQVNNYEVLLQAKEEHIKDQKEIIEFLKKQIEKLMERIPKTS